VRRYRTEIQIPADRVVVLHVPDDLPIGPASVLIQVEAPAPRPGEDDPGFDFDLDGQDIEWWEELEQESASDAARR
jgi:hypothetical protein